MERGPARGVLRDVRTLYTLGTLGGLTDAELLERFLARGGDDAEDAFAARSARSSGPVLGRYSMIRGSRAARLLTAQFEGKRPGIPPENPLLARSAPGLSTARLPSQSTQFSQTDSGRPREILPRIIFLDSLKALDEMGLDRQAPETFGWVH
jgi:hypothetical protein